jgi:hypothetical protein
MDTHDNEGAPAPSFIGSRCGGLVLHGQDQPPRPSPYLDHRSDLETGLFQPSAFEVDAGYGDRAVGRAGRGVFARDVVVIELVDGKGSVMRGFYWACLALTMVLDIWGQCKNSKITANTVDIHSKR